ncbi:hypothetical protein MPTK1_1g07020 [Marchantia polymorpha subsp. ruderalis]|uniref:Uncharacterized protein n=2 Tax=Marchantia polymorpha TaxID=3197 RepID=A0AAF6AME8_MARPO|nr:hypothetical protein MARPO_0043s0093 [Marchantia polymorpha]BBM97618.1 hypothetical protein Mp_1g07020 [Marchantia polymorpha subsp. ruderalis]|eukprot:PTQ39858.1 hypothetical protein MARPO_0043s0093 [Marchantia polymorpha]
MMDSVAVLDQQCGPGRVWSTSGPHAQSSGIKLRPRTMTREISTLEQGFITCRVEVPVQRCRCTGQLVPQNVQFSGDSAGARWQNLLLRYRQSPQCMTTMRIDVSLSLLFQSACLVVRTRPCLSHSSQTAGVGSEIGRILQERVESVTRVQVDGGTIHDIPPVFNTQRTSRS